MPCDVNSLKESIDILEKKRDDGEQYAHRNCLLVKGVEEHEKENTDAIVLNVFKLQLDLIFPVTDLDRSIGLVSRIPETNEDQLL